MIKRIKKLLEDVTHYHWTFMEMPFPTINLEGKVYKNPDIEQLEELMILQKKRGFTNRVRFILNMETNNFFIWDAFDINLGFDKILVNLNIQDKNNVLGGILNLENKTFKFDNMYFVTTNRKKEILKIFYGNKLIKNLNLKGME